MMFTTTLLAATVLPLVTAQSWTGLPGSLYAPSEKWAACHDSSWPQSIVGQPLIPQVPDAELEELLAEIDPDRVKNIITTLAGFHTRHTLSTQNSTTRGIGAARDWIMKQMQGFAAKSNGNMDVYLNSYIQGKAASISFPVNISNIVAQIDGTEDPNRVVVVTGHYDSRRIDIMDYTGYAPGADDDASGVAVAMEMARVCAKKKPKATMIFAAVAGEEQNLYGSTHLAKTLKKKGYAVEGHWNNVSVAFSRHGDWIRKLIEPGHCRYGVVASLLCDQRLYHSFVRSQHLLPQCIHCGN